MMFLNAGCIVRTLALVVFMLRPCLSQLSSRNNACSAIRNIYTSKGISLEDVPNDAIHGGKVSNPICPLGFTCCTSDMETRLVREARRDFENSVVEKCGFVRNMFVTKATKLEFFYNDVLTKSQLTLNDMFISTYGVLYQLNAYIFNELFDDMKAYMSGVNMEVLDVFDDFFINLMQKMFTLMNTDYTYDDSYLECIALYSDEVKPFQEESRQLANQVKRAFVAARAFVHGLQVGGRVINRVSEMLPTHRCGVALMKMSYCPYCKGYGEAKPCYDYCLNVMKGCLAYQSDLNRSWNEFIDAMLTVAGRLSGPYSIETVMLTFDYKISHAIMTFQDNNQAVSNQLMNHCGTPRRKRSVPETPTPDPVTVETEDDETTTEGIDIDTSADPSVTSEEGEKADTPKGGKGDTPVGDDLPVISSVDAAPREAIGAEVNLASLVDDLSQRLHIAKNIWTNLPYQICNDPDISARPENENNCWNGKLVGEYGKDVIDNGLTNQMNNPEVGIGSGTTDSLIQQQILELKLVIAKLRSAYNGKDVDFYDAGVDFGSSGSGSGSGDMDNSIPDSDFTFPGITDSKKNDIDDPNIRSPTGHHTGGAPRVGFSVLTVVCVVTLSLLMRVW